MAQTTPGLTVHGQSQYDMTRDHGLEKYSVALPVSDADANKNSKVQSAVLRAWKDTEQGFPFDADDDDPLPTCKFYLDHNCTTCIIFEHGIAITLWVPQFTGVFGTSARRGDIPHQSGVNGLDPTISLPPQFSKSVQERSSEDSESLLSFLLPWRNVESSSLYNYLAAIEQCRNSSAMIGQPIFFSFSFVMHPFVVAPCFYLLLL